MSNPFGYFMCLFFQILNLFIKNSGSATESYFSSIHQSTMPQLKLVGVFHTTNVYNNIN